ncbi:teichoic acid D-Ala incorporation-associated protein DltX [Weissella viridescens]|nr:teichoic acid D-Ala incorporation-associated protein DltX [Weissella viridescens]MBX4172330.1 teichoic acid D-Ala incorporation-associated protein DltX [Weissella viridescens]MCB6839460.1 teichoic acid D-Ala incorporation-associated protein DltX [Weissella viridescens]MCB6846191.1 teichoic acid D-Ala incorporation-associated protein DltX [Weissella viridescens]QOD85490.1 teichoic acid D-Ala incorporation-associated protein DltX [Weissella viridescens]WJI90599.1 teichoic acid D-Ala incorpora
MFKKHTGFWLFIIKTLFYFAVLLILLYFYGYSGHGQGGFIYNEF